MNYEDFDVGKLKFEEIINEKLNINHQCNRCSDNYSIINLKYNFNDFNILGCKMNFDFIHDVKNFWYEFREDYVVHTINDESENFIKVQIFDIDFVNFINKIYELCVNIVDKHKKQLGMPYFDIKYSRATGFHHPLCYQTDCNCNIIDDNPYMFFKLSHDFNKNIMYNEQNIAIPSDINIDFIPTLNIKLLCINNAQCRLKIEIIGMNVLSIT